MKKSDSIVSTPFPPTSGQMKEFHSQVADGRISRGVLEGFLKKSRTAKGLELMQAILGDDFISPDAVSEATASYYSKEQLRNFVKTVPSEEALRWCKANDYAILAGPPHPMNLHDICGVTSELWDYSGYCNELLFDQKEKSLQEDKVNCEWLIIGKWQVSEVHGPAEQQPNIAEMAWFMTTYFYARKIKLFEGVPWITTSSTLSDGFPVILGPHTECEPSFFSHAITGRAGIRIDKYSAGCRRLRFGTTYPFGSSKINL